MHAICGRHNDSVGQLIAGYFVRNTGYPVTGPFIGLAWIKDDQIVAQAILNDYTEANIEVHIYGPQCFTKKTIRDLYKYVFETLKCERMTAKPYCTNKKLLQLLTRLGFEYECTQERYYKEGNKVIDAEVYRLMKENVPKWVGINASA